MDEAAWVQAGLLDPAAPTAADRRALLEWLAGRGVDVAAMREAHGRGRLFGLAGDLHVRAQRPSLSLAEAAERLGMDADLMRRVWLAAGLPDPQGDEPVLSEQEADAFRVVATGAALLGERPVLEIATTVGTAVRRIAETVITAAIDEIGDMLLDRSSSELLTAQVYEASTALLPDLHALIRALHGLHHERTNDHVELGLLLGESRDQTVRLAVGFVDISGYTPLAQRLTRAELTGLVRRFTSWGADTVTRAGARVVQVLGDAVMFVGSPDAVCRAAHALLVRDGAEADLPDMRAGLALGEVVLRGGDYFGPVVNLAARLTTDAAPGQVLADPVLAAALGPPWVQEPQPPRPLKGIAEPVAPVRLTLRA